ncbi:AI-2E family transporter [Clostridium vincentii]|uniref:Pheromone autoinducer 2 transporter n=1 Tax=Clostridium vincentii TaxID=52704 RepID=A0A2T0BBN5_9CLOT|nr:AI-2E family transporter [Clostridium vincentii]PRR81309.1 pheromone autoinducer 2 transporter [Clostridium vincentii]
MLFNRNIKKRDILIIIFIILVGYIAIDNYTIVFNFIKRLIYVVSPFIYALVFAYVLNPIMKLLERKLKLRRGFAILSTYVLIIGIIIILLIFVVPNVIDSIISMTSEIPTYMETVQGWIDSAIKNEDLYNIVKSAGLLEYIDGLTKKGGTLLIEILQGSVSSIFLITANIIKVGFGFLVGIYVLLDKERLIKGVKTLMFIMLKEEKGQKLLFWTRTYNRMIGAYIGTKALDSLIIGSIALIGLIILKSPYAILLALVVGVTNMVPYFGPLVGELVGGIVGIFISPSMAIGTVLFLIVLQQFDAWYLDPKLVGNKVGVRPFFIIFGVMVGGGLFGVVGMLLGSPTMATLNIMYEHKVSILKVRNRNLMKRVEEEEDDEQENEVDKEE